MILNQYQNRTQFQGNLLKAGIKLPQKKFNEVAKIYAEKTNGMSDLILLGRLEHNAEGRFYHSTDAIINGEEVASIVTKSLKSMFKNLSPKKIAEELVNLTKKFDPKDKANILKREINDAQRKLIGLKFKLEHLSKPEDIKIAKALIERMEACVSKKEKQYNKIKPNSISDEWC